MKTFLQRKTFFLKKEISFVLSYVSLPGAIDTVAVTVQNESFMTVLIRLE